MNALWNEFLVRQGALLADQRVLHFGDAAQEMQAVASGTVIADLSHLGLLALSGDDTVTFLQGQVTNDVKLLAGGNSQYAGYCNAKGRMLALFFAFTHEGRLCLQLHGALLEPIMKRLKMYVLRSKVLVDNVSDSTVRIGVAGAGAVHALQQIFPAMPQAPHQLTSTDTSTLIRLPGSTPRFEIVTTPEHAPDLWAQLQQQCVPVGSPCWEWLKIQAGIPDVVPATQEAFVPQMLNLDLLDGINFKKGCYTGQEIVARTHYLGKVKRRTHLAHADATTAPRPGDPVYGSDGAEPVGMVVSAAPAPQGGFDLLAEVRLESVAAGPLRCNSVDGPPLELRELPYGF